MNLAMLARYLLTLPDDYDRFDMSTYSEGDIERAIAGDPPECGAVACAVGHGPAAGIPLYGADWTGYAMRNFTSESDEFKWMFGMEWYSRDNTTKGAALRITAILKYGGVVGPVKEISKKLFLLPQYWQENYNNLLGSLDTDILNHQDQWAD